MKWTVETLAIVDGEIEDLPSGLGAKLIRLLDIIEAYGLEKLQSHMPSILKASCGNCGLRRPKALRAEFMSR